MPTNTANHSVHSAHDHRAGRRTTSSASTTPRAASRLARAHELADQELGHARLAWKMISTAPATALKAQQRLQIRDLPGTHSRRREPGAPGPTDHRNQRRHQISRGAARCACSERDPMRGATRADARHVLRHPTIQRANTAEPASNSSTTHAASIAQNIHAYRACCADRRSRPGLITEQIRALGDHDRRQWWMRTPVTLRTNHDEDLAHLARRHRQRELTEGRRVRALLDLEQLA